MVTAATYSKFANNTASSWWNDPGLRRSVFHLFILYWGVFVLGYDGSLLTGLQAMPQWNAFFRTPAGNRLGLISAAYYLPKLVSPFVFSWLCDRFGRVKPLMLACLVMITGSAIGAAAQNEAMLIIGRVLCGAGTSGSIVSTSSLVSEITHPRLRSISSALFFCFYYIGGVLAAWLTFGTLRMSGDWSWRTPTLVQALGPLVVLSWTPWLVESPRWLMSKDRRDEAHRQLASYHANGKMDDELVLSELQQIDLALAREERGNAVSWFDLLRTPGNRRRSAVILIIGTGTQWNGVGLVSYYLAPVLRSVGITNSTVILGVNGGLTVFNLILSCLAALQVERVGRRPLFLVSLAGMLVCYIIITGLSAGFAVYGSTNSGLAVIAFLYIYYGFYDIAWTPLPFSYVPEIMPYHLRTKGIALLNFSQGASLAFNAWVNPVALAAIAWRYYAVYVALIAVYLVLTYFFILETKGRSFEEVTTVFDGPEIAAQLAREADAAVQHDVVKTSGSVDDKVATDDVYETKPVAHLERAH